jgi:hypothetical protein
MRQRKVVIGLLVVAALSFGLVPVAGNAGPEKAWACVIVGNPVMSQCTATATVTGGGLYYGTFKVYLNNNPTPVFTQNTAGCYHFSTVPLLPSGTGCKVLEGIGPGAVRVVADPGSVVVLGSRGD